VGAAALLLGAAGVFGQLKLALDTIWEIDRKPRRGFRERTWGAVRDNVLSFAGVAGAGFLLLVSLVLNAVIASIAERLPVAGVAALVLDALLALAVVVAVFASTFKFLPDARLAWRDALVGGAVTAVLFLLGQVAIGLFLGRAGFASSYGSSGAILALLVWVYYSSLILFFGAELTQVYANRFGAHVRPDRHGRAIQEAMREEHELPDVEGTEPLPKRAPRGRRRPE
jgi:membrane protein